MEVSRADGGLEMTGVLAEASAGEWLRLSVTALEESPIPAMVLREDGLVMYCNREMTRRGSAVLAEGKLEAGRNLLERDPGPFVRERLELIRRQAPGQTSMAVRNIIGGEQVISYSLVLPDEAAGGKRAVFIVQERMHGPVDARDFPGAAYYEPSHQALGVLQGLSRREIEVLALLGQGMTAAQIAARISRAEETVNTHKSALLRKLGCRNAAQLAVIAHRAGLKYEDGARFAS